MSWLVKAWNGLLAIFDYRRNSVFTPKSAIIDQMNTPRPLPMGVTEFKEWSERIIAGALIPTEDKDSLTAALASMLMSLGPTEDHKPDAYFIHALRKAATNEVAHAMFQEIKKRKQAQEDAEANKQEAAQVSAIS
jgi:hypothetical protein